VHQVDSLVDSSQGGAINSLSTDGTAGADTGGVFAGATVGDSVDEDLEGVEAGQEVDQVEGLLDESHGQLLLTVVAGAGNHHGADDTLDKGALDLLELLLLVAASGVGNVDLLVGGSQVEVSGEGNIVDSTPS